MHRSLVALALFLVSSLFAQTVQKIDVRVINVDVVVVDGSSGNAVTDLTKDDFEITEDGQPQPITNFTRVQRQQPAAGAARPMVDYELRRRLILIVDNNYIDKQDRDTALRTLDSFVDTRFDGSYELAMAMIGQQLEIVQPFTTEKSLIHEAVKQIRRSATTSFHDVMDRGILDDPIYQRRGLDVAANFESRERTNRNAR